MSIQGRFAKSPLFTVISASAVLALGVAAAEARDQRAGRYYERGHAGFVTAESRYGPRTVSGPVRYGRHGRLEVRLPGGTWLECGRSCSETLRRETIDFWESRTSPSNPYVDGPGYLNWWR